MNHRPQGFRFYPTEEELVGFYLRNKLERWREEELDLVIPVIDIYNLDPWHLPRKSGELCTGDDEWFFFSPRQEREAHGGRPNRITPSGYWKATGTPSHVYSANNRMIGMKRTMVFYEGKAPKGNKTKWKVNEFKALDETSTSSTSPQFHHEVSVCRVYVTSGCVRSFDRRPLVAGTREMLQGDESYRALFDPHIYNNEGTSNHSAEPSQENTSIEEQARNANRPQEEEVTADLKMMDDFDSFWNFLNSE